MFHQDFTDMDYDTWIRCPTSTNAVERKNYDSKSSVPQSLNSVLIYLYKIDKTTCAKHIVANKGHSISYNDKSIEKREQNAEKRRLQQKRKACESCSGTSNGPPDKQNDFTLATKR